MTGVMSPSSTATAIPMWTRLKYRMWSPSQCALTSGVLHESGGHAFEHDIVHRHFVLVTLGGHCGAHVGEALDVHITVR